MARERVGTEKIVRPEKSLVYLDKQGYVAAKPAGKQKGGAHRLSKIAITRKPGFLYYLGKSGYVERVPMKNRARG